MKSYNKSAINAPHREDEKFAHSTPSVTAEDLTKEESLLKIKKLELRIAELELQNEKLAMINTADKTIAHPQRIS